MTPNERDEAIAIANRLLDEPMADPDDDRRTLARRFMRAIERAAPEPAADQTCSRCYGSGTIEVPDEAGPNAHPMDVNCPACGGTGAIQPTKTAHFPKRCADEHPEVTYSAEDCPLCDALQQWVADVNRPTQPPGGVRHTEQESASDRLYRAAQAVCAYDWSDNDEDAVRAIERLRHALTNGAG